MTGEELVYSVLGPMVSFIMVGAVFLLGLALLRDIGRGG